MEIKEGYIKKCLENWYQIVRYIEDKYKDYLIIEDTTIFCDNCGSDDEDDWIKLYVDTNQIIVLYKAFNFHGLNFYYEGCGMLKKKYSDEHGLPITLQDFCYGVMVICNNWDKIKSNIESDIEKYKKVMDFKI